MVEKRSQSRERPWLGSMSRDEGLPQMPVAFSKPDRIMDKQIDARDPRR